MGVSFEMKYKAIILVMMISVWMFSGSFMTTVFAQSTVPCDSCGMGVDNVGQARFRIVDGNGYQHVACCPICAFKLIKTYGQLNITSFCDWNGPTYPITIVAKQNGSALTVNPQSALVILGGGCPKNRMVYDAAAANSLLAPPNNGSSRWLSPLTNATVLANATRMGVAQAVMQYAGGANSTCERCGMTVDVTGQARFKIFDSTGTLHVACCPTCALMLQRIYGDLNITAFCDYYGPSYPIMINSKNNGTDVSVTPSDALIILGGSCTKNRIVYNATGADYLLAAPNNGTSKWLSTMTNDTVLANATRMDVVQAALINGAGFPTPTPSPSPTASPSPSPSPAPTNSPIVTLTPSPSAQLTATPGLTSTPTFTETPATTFEPTSTPTNSPETNSPTPTATSPITTAAVTQQCEVCGMDVSPESQTRYRVTDGNGNVHYVECFMCALSLINDYETLHIQTFCDWNGPNYAINVATSNYGNGTFTVSPTTAMYIRGGSCVTARAAYNQSAANNLVANGYSQYTSPEQRYALPSNAEVMTITYAIQTIYGHPEQTNSPTQLALVLVAVAGVAVVAAAIVAFKKLKH
jgi:hypothetical protein